MVSTHLVTRQINAIRWAAQHLPYGVSSHINLMISAYTIRCLIALLGTLFVTSVTYAVDATSSATEVLQSGRWLVIEFAAKQQLIYRISSQATNSESSYLAIDFAPSRKCVPAPAVMSSVMSSYSPAFDQGLIPMSYRPPGQSESTEMVKTAMTPGDDVAFFQFKGLTAELLLKSRDKSSLAVWIPGSGDGTVKRSNNTFSRLTVLLPPTTAPKGVAMTIASKWIRCGSTDHSIGPPMAPSEFRR